MATYSIKDLEKLSGIKAHTIRIWEQRYNIIDPKRTATNIRYYDDADLKYLMNIAFLNKNGMRISQIARLTPVEIERKVTSISKGNINNTAQIQALTISMIELNEMKFVELLNYNIEHEGLEDTIINILVPFLEKLSILWLAGSISMVHEQFSLCLIRQKIISAIERIDEAALPQRGKKFLLYLPQGENEELEIILLLAHYLVKCRRYTSRHFGCKISMSDLEIAHKSYRPDYIYTILSDTRSKPNLETYLAQLTEKFPDTTFLISGYRMMNSTQPHSSKIVVLEDFCDTIDFIDKLSQK